MKRERRCEKKTAFSIASALGWDYQSMLRLGQHILDGGNPDEFMRGFQNEAHGSISASLPAFGGSMEAQQPEQQEKEVLTDVLLILRSKPEHRATLTAVVKALADAVKREGEMNHLEQLMVQMQGESQKKMERLEQLILAMGGAVPEKRDNAANS